MAETIFSLGRQSPQVNLEGITVRLFANGVKRAIEFYQQKLVGISPRTTPHFAQGMEVLTGQPSTSEWTRQEVERAFERSGRLAELGATLGVALLFISQASFAFDSGDGDNGVLVVSYPLLTDHAQISFSPSNTHIIIDPEISARESLRLFIRGTEAFLDHLGWCYLAMARKLPEFGKDRRVGPNERIVQIEKGGWGQPTIAKVEVIDKPEEPGGWGKSPTPRETHVEDRIKFKEHYHYKPDQVERREGW